MFLWSEEGKQALSAWKDLRQGFIVREVLHDLVMHERYEVGTRAEILSRYAGELADGFRVIVLSDAELRVELAEARLRFERANLAYWRCVDEQGAPDPATQEALLHEAAWARQALDQVLDQHAEYEQSRALWRSAHPIEEAPLARPA
ncbi:MAG TPA: hypothetical protein PK668_02175 [Myxococcota bacterium]|nr:hypothetical protein [Myxococcota bacterium]HRY94624.1 hypothetical protein [Myxococcota bacterium]HSA21491.1 hypothetical protein [Myxococcota bacterium]